MSITAENLRTEREPAEAGPNRRRRTRVLRSALGIGVLLAIAGASWHTQVAPSFQADPQLGQLLQGIALIKAALTVLALGVVYWRLSRPIENRVAAAYLGGVWFMAGASMLVWELAHVGWGAVLFHAGELTILLVAWREHRVELAPVRQQGDPAAVGHQLELAPARQTVDLEAVRHAVDLAPVRQ
jgi:hypothetical protein